MFGLVTALEKGMPLNGTIKVPFADGKKGHLFADKSLFTVEVRRQRAVVGQERLRQRRQDHDPR